MALGLPAEVSRLGRLVSKINRALGFNTRRRSEAALEATGMFDRARYLELYPDVAAAGIDPMVHYLDTGAREGRSPCEFFDSAYYLDLNPEVARSGINPLVHFSQLGWRESRNPSAEFDLDWYAATHLPDAAETTNPLRHYQLFGREMGLEVRPVRDPEVEAVLDAGVFDASYYVTRYPDVAGIDPLRHYLRYGAAEGRNPSALFDSCYYLENNPDVALEGKNPLTHFCERGWRELRNPSRDFDVWWYWSIHLDPAIEGKNPLGHYQTIGHSLGLSPRPPQRLSQLPGTGHRYSTNAEIRRVCLFAGYDRDGLIDDYVVSYVRHLSRHADVYYLADCGMQPGELEKLVSYTKGAWAERHGEYDFGSFSRLARRLGWDVIAGYDELLLVNDSCYLLRDLDDVFARMDARACDWWGLQATKGIAATRANPSNRFRRPIPVDTVRRSLLESFEREYQYDFLVGSYFLAYRAPVIADLEFRRQLEAVSVQDSKKNLVLKYEVGLTRLLIARGYVFDTFVSALYPFHPIFSTWYFNLLDEGFPLLKRYLLSENHYAVPRLYDWAERIREKTPAADISTIEANLARTVDPDHLYRNLHIGTERLIDDPPPSAELLDDDRFVAADQTSPKHRNWWAFPVCAFTGAFSGNERALFEEVKNDPLIRKIILTRGKPVEIAGENVEVVALESPLGQHRLMRAANIFVKHSPTRNLVYPVSGDLHNIINLWHGIPFKRIGYVSADMIGRQARIADEHAKCRAVISSSRIDTLAMSAAFYPLTYDQVWNTGLPRNDFVLRAEERLPTDLRDQLRRLQRTLNGRRLILFMPTFRNAQQDGYYRFTCDEKSFLHEWLERNNAVLGLREHMADSAQSFSHQLHDLGVLDLADAEYPNVEVLYRASSALITDYSSCFIDYMLTDKPALSFAYDYDRYTCVERGAFYDLEQVFPGPVCRTFGQLRDAIEVLFRPLSPVETAKRRWQRELFFDHFDDCNSARVVARVKEITDCSGVGLPLLNSGSHQ